MQDIKTSPTLKEYENQLDMLGASIEEARNKGQDVTAQEEEWQQIFGRYFEVINKDKANDKE